MKLKWNDEKQTYALKELTPDQLFFIGFLMDHVKLGDNNKTSKIAGDFGRFFDEEFLDESLWLNWCTLRATFENLEDAKSGSNPILEVITND